MTDETIEHLEMLKAERAAFNQKTRVAHLQVAIDTILRLRTELAQLRACHEAELGVCQQHCDIVQKSEQEIRRLERLVEKGVPPGPPDPPRPLVRKDFG